MKANHDSIHEAYYALIDTLNRLHLDYDGRCPLCQAHHPAHAITCPLHEHMSRAYQARRNREQS